MNSSASPYDTVVIVLDQGVGQLRMVDEELHGVDLWPSTHQALRRFRKEKLHVTVIVQAALGKNDKKLLQTWLFGTDVVRCDPAKPDALFSHIKKLAGPQTLFVAADRSVRSSAARQGYTGVPHVAVAELLAQGEKLAFAQVSGAPEHFERLNGLLPYGFARRNPEGWALFGLLTQKAIAVAADRGLMVHRLPLDIAQEDPLFVQLDARGDKTVDTLARSKVLLADGRRVLLAMGPDALSESLDLQGAHRYFELLMPRPELIDVAPTESIASRKTELLFARWPREKLKELEIIPVEKYKPKWPLVALCPATAESFQHDVDRYTGVASLDDAGPIISRHILHPDNERAVDGLVKDLRNIGYCVSTPTFSYAGRTLRNVVADLPGRGLYVPDPNIIERLREILLKYPWPDPPHPWRKEIENLIGVDWFRAGKLEKLTAAELRWSIEDLFELKSWKYWWWRLCKVAGIGAQIVIVGCHLDSTANFDGTSYDPASDSAPGADDNASGIASTLAVARWLWNFRDCLRHTVRFCFFNAEESGFVGSKAYASAMKCLGAPIKAVVTTDMCGYNSDAARIFELHAGYTDPAVRDLSVPVAQLVESWAASLGTLAPAQVYQGVTQGGPGSTDRTQFDGAINRSDHASFHEQGYPAIVVSEDFFVNLPTEPGADPNPNYHRSVDTVIDAGYAADITCAVAHAVKELAS